MQRNRRKQQNGKDVFKKMRYQAKFSCKDGQEKGRNGREVMVLSRVQLFVMPWTLRHPSMTFFRQEYCSGSPFPPPGNLPNLGIKSRSPALQADALPSEPPGKPPAFQKKQKILRRGDKNTQKKYKRKKKS